MWLILRFLTQKLHLQCIWLLLTRSFSTYEIIIIFLHFFTLYLFDIFISYTHAIQFPDLPIQCELWDLSIEHVFQLNHLEAKKLQLHTEADQLPILRVEIWIISSKPEEKWQKCWLLLSSCSPSISSLYTFCQYYRYISQHGISEVS